MRKMKKLLGLLLAVLFLVGQLPGAIGTARAAQDDEFLYPKLSYSNSEGIKYEIITMGSVNYLVYTITKDGTLTIDGNYIADLWLAGGGADGQTNINENNTSLPQYGGGSGYTTNVVNMLLRSGDITIGPGGGGTTTYAYDDPLNPGQPRILTAAGGNGADGGSGGGKGGKGQGRSTRPFGASEMPAYCQGGWSSNYGNSGYGFWPPMEPGSDGGNGADCFNGSYCYDFRHKDNVYIYATGTGGVGGGVGPSQGYTIYKGNDATAFGGGGSGGNPGGKGYQGAMMIRIALSTLHPADYSSVDAAISWANSLPKDRYKDFTPVTNAINAVDRTKVASEQAQVNAMASAITAAVGRLESTGADYSMVDQLYAYALALKTSDYEDFSGVIAALTAVNRNKTIEQQAEVNTMATNIFAAINALVPLPADYTAVDAALAAISRLPDPSYYVSLEGIAAAKSIVVRGKTKAQQVDVDAMYMTLINAIENLQLKPADYTVVDQNIRRAAQLDARKYTNFDTVFTAARAIDRTKNILEQPEVDNMATSLMTAIDNLKYAYANYEAVDTALRYAKGLDEDDYTNFDALTSAMGAVVREKSIDEQEAVDKMAADIITAILALEYAAPDPTPTPTPDTSPTPTPVNTDPAVPAAPQSFTATPGNGQVALIWLPPANNGGSAITRYQVSKDNGTTWIEAGLDTSYIFAGLTNGTVYTFKVRAINSIGNGAASTAAATPMSAVPNQSNGVTLDQLQALLNKNKTTPTLGLPKTGDQRSRWGVLCVALAIPAVIYFFRSRKQKRSK